MRISIITATYNSSRTILDCIESVQNQTFKEIDHIIVDGESRDDTIALIRSVPNRISKIISEQDKGIYDAMNKGIEFSSGEIVAILNSDDLYIDEFVIEKVMGIFETTGTDCVYGDLFYVDKLNTNSIVRSWKTDKYKPFAFYKGWHPAHPSFFLKKKVYDTYGYFDLSFSLAADFELMLRMIERFHIDSVYYPFPLVKMRLGGKTNISLKNIYLQNRECIRAFEKNGLKVSKLYPFYRLIPKLKQFSSR